MPGMTWPVFWLMCFRVSRNVHNLFAFGGGLFSFLVVQNPPFLKIVSVSIGPFRWSWHVPSPLDWTVSPIQPGHSLQRSSRHRGSLGGFGWSHDRHQLRWPRYPLRGSRGRQHAGGQEAANGVRRYQGPGRNCLLRSQMTWSFEEIRKNTTNEDETI